MPDLTQPEYRTEQLGEWSIRWVPKQDGAPPSSSRATDSDWIFWHGEECAVANDRGLDPCPISDAPPLPWDVVEKVLDRRRLRNDARIDEESNI